MLLPPRPAHAGRGTFPMDENPCAPSRPDPVARAVEIARAVSAAGGRALIVGGWVRDRWLGLASKDLDIEVYGLEAPDLRRLLERFGRVDAVGESLHGLQGRRHRRGAAAARVEGRAAATAGSRSPATRG